MTAWIDGRLTDDPVRVGVDEPGWTLGLGVFTTVAVEDGRPELLGRHLRRLRSDADRLGPGVPYDDADLRAAVTAVIAATVPTGSARLRITAAGGPDHATRVVIAARPTEPRPAVATVVLSPWRRAVGTATAGTKTTSYADQALEIAHGRRLGVDEVISTDPSGAISEGATSNVFAVVDGALLTPSATTGCLPGVMRGLVIELTGARETDRLTWAGLEAADEVFLTSALRRIQPVARVGERSLPRPPGPVTRAAVDALADLLARATDP